MNDETAEKRRAEDAALFNALLAHFDRHNAFVWNCLPLLLGIQAAVLGGSWAAGGTSRWVAGGVCLVGILVTLSLSLYVRKTGADREVHRANIEELGKKFFPGFILTTKLRPRAREILYFNLMFFLAIDVFMCGVFVAPIVFPSLRSW